jgi:probable F420-dependent oxidoreductase
MDFGIAFANVGAYADPEHAVTLGRHAEEHGFDSLWAIEHPVVPKGYESVYPYSREGRMPGPEQAPMPDPLSWLTWVGAHTTTLRLGTGILILPLRSPVVLAKQCATIDRLTGGRFTLGVGVGWLREEFDAAGVPWDDRAARTDDSIVALRALWEQEESSHNGSHSSFQDVYSFPKPAAGTVPVVVGGHSKAAARRAGRLGDGFFPSDHRKLPELVPAMREAALDAGRDPDAIEITTGGRADVDTLKALADSGVSRFVVMPPSPKPAELGEAMARYADEVIARV